MEKESQFIPDDKSSRSIVSEIMTFEKYAGIEHEIPYVYEIEGNGKKLVYFGEPHSNNVENPVFQQIEQKMQEANPQVVLVEGMSSLSKWKKEIIERLKETDRSTVIKEMGTPSFTIKLAAEKGIDVECPEPDFSDEIEHLVKQGLDKDKIFAYYVYRSLHQYHREKVEKPVEEYLEPYIDKFERFSHWPGFDYSLNNLRGIGTQIWGELGSLEKDYPFRATPGLKKTDKDWTEVNQVAQECCIFRDQFIVARMAEVLKEKDRVFIVYGASHAVMQEPALEKLLNSKSRKLSQENATHRHPRPS